MRQKLISSLTGVVIALLLGAVIMAVQGYNPIETYGALLDFSAFNSGAFATTLKNAVPLILTGLSASIAFASGPVNLGQPGQLVIGAMCATVVGLAVDLPAPIQAPLLLIVAMLGGAAWSGIAALLRRAFNMSEFIVTLMLNSIADLFAAWLIAGPVADRGAGSPTSPPIAASGWLGNVGPINVSVLVMVLAFIIVWFVFTRTTAGYEWRMAGQNEVFARLGGCEVNRNFVVVMLLTGALAGLAGGMVIMSGPHRFLRGIGANYAWDGIMIAVVANNGLLGTVLYGIFFAMLQTGALGTELITNVPSEFTQVLQAIIVLIVVAGRVYLARLLDQWAARRIRQRSVVSSQ